MAAESDKELIENRLFSHFKGWLWAERGRDTNSWLWAEGYDIQNGVERRWVCKSCVALNRGPIISFKATGLQNARSHLWRSHRIGAPEGEKMCEAQQRDEGIANAYHTITSVFKLDPQQTQQQKVANSLIRSFDRQRLFRMLLELLIESNLPFHLLDNPRFRKLLEYLNPSAALQSAIPSSTRIRRSILLEYRTHRQKVIQILQRCPGKIHISFDGWTSPNQFALYGIMCFYRNETGQPCKLLLGVPEAYRHFGTTIAGEVLEVLHTFGIERNKIGYFTLDNAENNSTAMEVIGGELGFNGRQQRPKQLNVINELINELINGQLNQLNGGLY
jgi:hypothetical protein